MVYAQLTFKEDYKATVKGKDKQTRTVTFKSGETYGVDALDERGRTADFRFMVVPEGSEAKEGDVAEIYTAILAVNLASYWEHKKSKLQEAEDN